MSTTSSQQLPLIFNVTQLPETFGTGHLDDLLFIFDNLDQPFNYQHGGKPTPLFPIKCESLFLIYIIEGVLDITINLREEHVRAGQILVMMPGSIFQPKAVSDEIRMFSIIVDTEFAELMRKNLRVNTAFVPRYYHHVVHTLNEATQRNCMEMFIRLKGELAGADYTGRKDVVQRYLEIWMLKNHALIDNFDKPELNKPLNRKEQIFQDFLSLLEKHYTQERSISFYASCMCLTPKYLSTIIKEVSGKHGMQWIDEFVSLEAKALLRDSDLSVKQVSDQLNFPSQSMFGRFFKKMTGYSPKQYKML